MSGRPADRRAADRRRTAGHRLEVILDVTRRLMSVTDLGSLLHLMAEATRELLAADRATIFIVDHDRAELWSRVALGTSDLRLLRDGFVDQVARKSVNRRFRRASLYVSLSRLTSVAKTIARRK